jgi:hypothetical protein
MAVEMWKAGKDVYDVVTKLVSDYHPDLVMVLDEIAVIFRERASKAGGRVILGKSRKAPAIVGVLGDTEYKFILELASDEWSGLTGAQKTALLDHHLCACRTEENPQTGDFKCFVAPPDVTYYNDEMDRHGDWRPREENEASEAPITTLFVSDDGTPPPDMEA